jgi:hypothetical protein
LRDETESSKSVGAVSFVVMGLKWRVFLGMVYPEGIEVRVGGYDMFAAWG